MNALRYRRRTSMARSHPNQTSEIPLQGTGAQSDPMKWNMPGWRVERKFDNGILIGNWYEERRTLPEPNLSSTSSHSIQSQESTLNCDVLLRKTRSYGRPPMNKALLFGHHGKGRSRDLITWYDEDIGRQGARPKSQKLPQLRSWDSKSQSWQPEKRDHPIQGAPTDWGLTKQRGREWQQALAERASGGGGLGSATMTTYSTHFWPKQPDHSAVRYGVPRDLTTTLREYSRAIHGDGDLRNVPMAPSALGHGGPSLQ